jgi:hypothetical protein
VRRDPANAAAGIVEVRHDTPVPTWRNLVRGGLVMMDAHSLEAGTLHLTFKPAGSQAGEPARWLAEASRNQLYAVAATMMDLKQGGCRCVGATILPPGGWFLHMGLMTFGLMVPSELDKLSKVSREQRAEASAFNDSRALLGEVLVYQPQLTAWLLELFNLPYSEASLLAFGYGSPRSKVSEIPRPMDWKLEPISRLAAISVVGRPGAEEAAEQAHIVSEFAVKTDDCVGSDFEYGDDDDGDVVGSDFEDEEEENQENQELISQYIRQSGRRRAATQIEDSDWETEDEDDKVDADTDDKEENPDEVGASDGCSFNDDAEEAHIDPECRDDLEGDLVRVDMLLPRGSSSDGNNVELERELEDTEGAENQGTVESGKGFLPGFQNDFSEPSVIDLRPGSVDANAEPNLSKAKLSIPSKADEPSGDIKDLGSCNALLKEAEALLLAVLLELGKPGCVINPTAIFSALYKRIAKEMLQPCLRAFTWSPTDPTMPLKGATAWLLSLAWLQSCLIAQTGSLLWGVLVPSTGTTRSDEQQNERKAVDFQPRKSNSERTLQWQKRNAVMNRILSDAAKLASENPEDWAAACALELLQGQDSHLPRIATFLLPNHNPFRVKLTRGAVECFTSLLRELGPQHGPSFAWTPEAEASFSLLAEYTEGGATQKARWGCPICDTAEMTSRSQLQEHLGSKGHAKKIAQSKTSGEDIVSQKKQAIMTLAVAQAASTPKTWVIGREMQVRNEPTQSWRRATVAGFEPGTGEPLAQRDGQLEALTPNEMTALNSDGSSYRLQGEDGDLLPFLPMPQQERWGCVLCGIAKMNAESQLQEHLSSKSHAKKLAFIQTKLGEKRTAPKKVHAVMTPAAAAALALLAAKAATPVQSANPDDWFCRKCNNVNWARRTQCNLCGENKYLSVDGGGGGRNWPPPFYAEDQQPLTYAPPPGMGNGLPPHQHYEQNDQPSPVMDRLTPTQQQQQQQPPHQLQKLHDRPPPPPKPSAPDDPPSMQPPPGMLVPPSGFVPAQKQQQALLPISQRAVPAVGWPAVSDSYHSAGVPPAAGPTLGAAYSGYGLSAASGPSPSSFAPPSFPSAPAAPVAPSAPVTELAPMLADGWCAQTDPSDGSRFYWHPTTGATTWDIPLANQQPAQPLAPACALTMPPLPHGNPSILPEYMYGGASGMYE